MTLRHHPTGSSLEPTHPATSLSADDRTEPARAISVRPGLSWGGCIPADRAHFLAQARGRRRCLCGRAQRQSSRRGRLGSGRLELGASAPKSPPGFRTPRPGGVPWRGATSTGSTTRHEPPGTDSIVNQGKGRATPSQMGSICDTNVWGSTGREGNRRVACATVG